jgi:hypothetical protein
MENEKPRTRKQNEKSGKKVSAPVLPLDTCPPWWKGGVRGGFFLTQQASVFYK